MFLLLRLRGVRKNCARWAREKNRRFAPRRPDARCACSRSTATARIAPDPGRGRFPATMPIYVSQGNGRQINSSTCTFPAKAMGTWRALQSKSTATAKTFNTEVTENTEKIVLEPPTFKDCISPGFFSVIFVASVLKLGKYYPSRICAARETTLSAIARDDVSPGDSIPIN